MINSPIITRCLSWCLSGAFVALLIVIMLALQGGVDAPDKEITVRRVDVTLPPPPPPAPPIQIKKSVSEARTPSINVAGLGSGPEMHYSVKPEIGITDLTQIASPEFNMAMADMVSTLNVDFPVLEVKALDAVPRSVSSGTVRYPRSLSKRGIVNVETQVELIIDTQGNAYIKKIIDPVYPEMVDPIRQWVKNVQFTKPTKNGQPVQAVYVYSLVFHYRI